MIEYVPKFGFSDKAIVIRAPTDTLAPAAVKKKPPDIVGHFAWRIGPILPTLIWCWYLHRSLNMDPFKICVSPSLLVYQLAFKT